MEKDNSNDERREWRSLLVVALLFSLIFQFVIAFANHGEEDVLTFNYVWATDHIQNIFHIYDISSLDYPPLFPVLLRLFNPLLLAFPQTLPVFLIMKFIPITGLALLGVAVARASRKYNSSNIFYFEALVLFSTVFNPVLIFNAAVWGQIDSLLVLLLFLTFFNLLDDHPYLAAIFFAIGCLTKLQFCYFAVPFVAALFIYYKWKIGTRALLTGMTVGVAGWLPFIIGSSDVMLPLKIYLGGSGKYQFMNLQAFNLYGSWTIFGVDSSKASLGFFNGNVINMLVLLISSLCVSIALVLIRKNNRLVSLSLAAYLTLIFIFSMQQHERYQIPVIAFLLLAVLVEFHEQDSIFLIGFSLMTFVNEVFAYYGGYFTEVSPKWFNILFQGFSILNVMLSIAFCVYVVREISISAFNPKSIQGEPDNKDVVMDFVSTVSDR